MSIIIPYRTFVLACNVYMKSRTGKCSCKCGCYCCCRHCNRCGCNSDVTVAGGGIIRVVGTADIAFVLTLDVVVVVVIVEVVLIGCVVFMQT